MAAQAIEWPPLRLEGKVIEGWYQNTTNKNLQEWNAEGFVREYTPKEFETYSKELEGYAGYSSENSTSTADTVKTIMRDTPGINEANAEDVAKVVENSRDAPPDAFPTGSNPGELGEGTIDGLDGVGQEGGNLAVGAAEDTGPGAGVTPFLGPVVLGAAAFTAGALLGNAFDEITGLPSLFETVGIPSWADLTAKSEEKHAGSIVRFKTEVSAGEQSIKVPGYYLQCRGNEFKEDLTYSAYPEHPAETIEYGCEGKGNEVITQPCKGERCSEPGYLQTDVHEYELVCKESSETEHPLAQNCAGAVEPLQVPKPAPMPVEDEESNSAHGVEHAPKPYTNPDTITKPDTQTEHFPHKSSPYELLLPAPGKNGYAPGDPEPRASPPTQTELEDEVGKSPHTEAEPLANYLEKPENSPNKTEAESEPEPEAEAPGAVGPPALPGFKFPELGVLCKGFPFGVPCWLINSISSWSASASCPSLGIQEFSIKGHKIPEANTSLCPLEPIMEKVRPAMLTFATIGLLILFYSFARGGSPPSGGGTSDTGDGYKETFEENDAYYKTDWMQ